MGVCACVHAHACAYMCGVIVEGCVEELHSVFEKEGMALDVMLAMFEVHVIAGLEVAVVLRLR